MPDALPSNLCLFGLDRSRGLAESLAAELGLTLAGHEEHEYEDGEHKARPIDPVRGKDVYVLHSLHGEPGQSGNDKLCRLLFFIATLRDHGALRVTAVVPHLCYGRKDRRTRPGDPVVTRYVAQLFEAVGTDRVLTIDAHNEAASENAFRCGFDSISAWPLFAERLAELAGDAPVAVISPDAGGWKRSDAMRIALAERLGRPVALGLMEKRRRDGVLSGEELFGDVAGCTVVLVDDLIATGSTLVRAAHAAREAGARRVLAAATHGLFVEDAPRRFADSAVDRLLVSDTVPPFRLVGSDFTARSEVLGCAPLLAQAIRSGYGC